MDYAYLLKQVQKSAIKSAGHSRQINMSELWDYLSNIQTDIVLPRIAEVRPYGWYGAIPTWENVESTHDPKGFVIPIVGIDGSQIYPDPDSPVKWGFIQTVQFLSGQPETFESQFIDADTLSSNVDSADNSQIEAVHINTLRTDLEVHTAEKAACEHPDSLVLLDNALLPYVDYTTYSKDWLESYIEKFLKMRGKKIAGYISGPASSLIINLISLANPVTEFSQKVHYINDSMLMQYGLNKGQRSAIFLHGSRRNLYMQEKGTSIFFFYLKVSDDEIARVEIPEWIARDSEQVDTVHASILKDSAAFSYPASLFFAHYKVAIPLSVGEELNRLALRIYMENHGYFRLSAKKRMKGLQTK